ncbi:hypothetical protein FVEG_16521 [Fusarium verticillioides 7600]|uniref:Uncharacterized protein n=1 Tax=Gibberella moniliformis (strain M3125 / FGSC 7600) TaxID=334819 RepID=W7MDL2_GIBM7|nr:hypothetical protein FVEG_16521 [Fusarium verticillioides 7600]EWG49648.1 hypothetical protein FVEG_16521 [Fusarium verticillioides 7600]
MACDLQWTAALVFCLELTLPIIWVSSDHLSLLGNDLRRKTFLLLYTSASITWFTLATTTRDIAQVAIMVLISINACTFHPLLTFIPSFLVSLLMCLVLALVVSLVLDTIPNRSRCAVFTNVVTTSSSLLHVELQR